MTTSHTISVTVIDQRGFTSEISLPGDGDLLHLISVFQLVLSLLGLSVEPAAEHQLM